MPDGLMATGASEPSRLPIAVVSVSGGNDSMATAICAIERYGRERVKLVFSDVGNEHEITLDYVNNYMPRALGMPIHTVRANFDKEIERKREYVAEKWPAKLMAGRPGKWRLVGKGPVGDEQETELSPPTPGNPYQSTIIGQWAWSRAFAPVSAETARLTVERALGALHPTGVPFLDLCIWKGRFPSRQAQFCTQELKRYPLDFYMMELAKKLGVRLSSLESWQGVRRDESQARRNALDRELTAEGWWVERPIAGWTAAEVVEFVQGRGYELNRLYSLGCHRVGCMLCINAGKDEIANCAKRFPEHIEKISMWECAVGLASKMGFSTLLHHADGEGGDAEKAFAASNIDAMVAWAMTSRGGKQFDWLRSIEAPAACSSVYGLCE